MLETLVHAFVTSRVDWCNSLLFGLPDTTVSKIQTVHNACAKFLTGGKRFDSATEKCKELHWLPVKYRIKYKILILAHKIIHPADSCNIPAYLKTNLKIENNENVRFTRSQLGPTFVPPNSKLKTVSDRSHRVGIPQLWNQLPLNLRCFESLNLFKKQIKTHFFNFHFT